MILRRFKNYLINTFIFLTSIFKEIKILLIFLTNSIKRLVHYTVNTINQIINYIFSHFLIMYFVITELNENYSLYAQIL